MPKLKLKEAAEVAALLRREVRSSSEATTVIPIQVIVHSGGPLVAGVVATDP